MNRSMSIALGLALVTTPALAQQPLQPAPVPPTPQRPYRCTAIAYAQPQCRRRSRWIRTQQYGEPDEEDDSIDVTYDISTSPGTRRSAQYDDGYDPNAYQQFESQLAPYGSWQDVPDYGHVWMPSSTEVGYDFSPYVVGRPLGVSDYGWTWVSDYDWGWAPFHYGRWVVAGGYGWCWMPGTAGARPGCTGAGAAATSAGRRWVRAARRSGRRAACARRGASPSPGSSGAAHPHFLPSRAVASVWHDTTAIHNVASINLRGTQVRFNAGPSAHLVAAATGRAIAPTPLHTVAPRALPHQAITPRIGTPLHARPWMQSRPALGGTFARPVPGSHTLGSGPMVSRPGAVMIRRGRSRMQPIARRSRCIARRRRSRIATASGSRITRRRRITTPRRCRRIARRRTGVSHTRRRAVVSLRGAGAVVSLRGAAQSYHYAAPMQTYHAARQYHYSAPTLLGAALHARRRSRSTARRRSRSTRRRAAAARFHSAGSSGFHGGGGGFHGGGHR